MEETEQLWAHGSLIPSISSIIVLWCCFEAEDAAAGLVVAFHLVFVFEQVWYFCIDFTYYLNVATKT